MKNKTPADMIKECTPMIKFPQSPEEEKALLLDISANHPDGHRRVPIKILNILDGRARELRARIDQAQRQIEYWQKILENRTQELQEVQQEVEDLKSEAEHWAEFFPDGSEIRERSRAWAFANRPGCLGDVENG